MNPLYSILRLSLGCLAIAGAMRCTFDHISAQDVVAPTLHDAVTTTPHVGEKEVTLFRPWDGTPWLSVVRHGDNDWHPSFVNILSDYQPIVKRVGDQYEITFTSPIANGLP